MPTTAAKKKAAKRSRKRSANKRVSTRRRRAAPLAHTQITHGDGSTYILVPLDEYEELIKAEMERDAVRTLESPDTEWIDFDDAKLKLAGRKLAEARKAKGLTQVQLSRKVGLPQSQISRIERNPDRTTLRTLKRIARALNTDVSLLVD